MSFDEIYKEFYPTLVRYCCQFFPRQRCYAEDAADRAFVMLYRKWDEMASHDDRFLKSWLLGTVQLTSKEVRRHITANIVSLDEQWCVDLIEDQQLEGHPFFNEVLEEQRFLDYIDEIKKELNPGEWELFELAAIKSLPHSEVARAMQLSVNATRIRWCRLLKKLKPLVEELIKK